MQQHFYACTLIALHSQSITEVCMFVLWIGLVVYYHIPGFMLDFKALKLNDLLLQKCKCMIDFKL